MSDKQLEWTNRELDRLLAESDTLRQQVKDLKATVERLPQWQALLRQAMLLESELDSYRGRQVQRLLMAVESEMAHYTSRTQAAEAAGEG